MIERVKMGLGEEIIREYPLHKTSEKHRRESLFLTVTNKRIIYRKSSSEGRQRSTELRDIPIKSIDTVESFLAVQKDYSFFAIGAVALVFLAGIIFLALSELAVGLALVGAAALGVALILLLTRSDYNFYLSIGTLGGREFSHMNFGASALSARRARNRTSHRIRVRINGAEIDKLVAELGAIIIRFKEDEA